jgi:four helix bundle protein
MEGHRDLLVWQLAMELVEDVYSLTRSFPKEELFGLSSQMRRAAVSVPSNIAEGYGRNSKNELRQFLGQARGSICELQTQLELCRRLKYASEKDANPVIAKANRVGQLVTRFRDWSAREKAKGAAAD